MKNQALTGGGNYGGTNIVEEIEESITRLRDDFNEVKKSTLSELTIIRNDLERKFTKDDGSKLEVRMNTYIESVVIQMKGLFLEKEPLQKRLNKIDRGVRLLKNDLTTIKDKEPDEDTGMFTKRALAQ